MPKIYLYLLSDTIMDQKPLLASNVLQHEVNTIVLKIAKSVFDNIKPAGAQPKISAEDVNNSLEAMAAVVDPKQAISYLTSNDGEYSRKLILTVQTGFEAILKDGQINVSDLPSILIMIKELGHDLNSIHSKGTAFVEIGVHSLVPLVQIVVLLVLQMLLPGAEFAMIRPLVCVGFDLLTTTVIALSRRKWVLWNPFDCCKHV